MYANGCASMRSLYANISSIEGEKTNWVAAQRIRVDSNRVAAGSAESQLTVSGRQ